MGASEYLHDVLKTVRQTGNNVLLENIVTKVEYYKADEGAEHESLRTHVARVGPDGVVYTNFVILVVLQRFISRDGSTVRNANEPLVKVGLSSGPAKVTSTTDDIGIVTSTSQVTPIGHPSERPHTATGFSSADSLRRSRTSLSDASVKSVRSLSSGEPPIDSFTIHYTIPPQFLVERSGSSKATMVIDPAAKFRFERLACIMEMATEAGSLYRNTSTNCYWIARWVWCILTKTIAPEHISWDPTAMKPMGRRTLGKIPIRTVGDGAAGLLLLSTEGATEEWLEKCNKRWADAERAFQDASEASIDHDSLSSLR